MAPHLARGLHVSLGRGKSTPRESGTPMLLLLGSGEAEVVPDRVLGSSALMTSMGLGQGGRHSRALGDLVANTLLSPLVGYAYY
jgi:hypothetical protein